jgi:hypothetical protein
LGSKDYFSSAESAKYGKQFRDSELFRAFSARFLSTMSPGALPLAITLRTFSAPKLKRET